MRVRFADRPDISLGLPAWRFASLTLLSERCPYQGLCTSRTRRKTGGEGHRLAMALLANWPACLPASNYIVNHLPPARPPGLLAARASQRFVAWPGASLANGIVLIEDSTKCRQCLTGQPLRFASRWIARRRPANGDDAIICPYPAAGWPASWRFSARPAGDSIINDDQ